MNLEYKKVKQRWLSFLMANIISISSILTYVPMNAFATSNNKDITNVMEKVDQTISNINKIQDVTDTARVYVNNTPIRLEVSKIKTSIGDYEGLHPNSYNEMDVGDNITYKWSGRINGSITELINIYGTENIELAYAPNGTYLGYGWKKGTLEYLESRKEKESKNNEIVDIKYNEYGVFEGYGYITKKLETTDDYNRYVAGAVMTLYDAVEIYRNIDLNGDDRFPGVMVKRNSNGDVISVYVEKGYAGNKIEYVLSNGKAASDMSYDVSDDINDTGDGIWIAKSVERGNTPILYYNFNDLNITSNDTYYTKASDNTKEIDKVFGFDRYDKDVSLYGFDKYRNVVNVTQKDEYDFTIFAFRKGDTNPVFEFDGGNYNEIKYNARTKTIEVGEGTVIYHLDEEGKRDAMVDPQTGIAYVAEEINKDEINKDVSKPNRVNEEIRNKSYSTHGRIYVWPVNISKDGTGSETFEKIKTNRIASINEDTSQEYTTGTYTGTEFAKKLNPTYDENGLPIYYQKTNGTYIKGSDRYDRDGDYLGYGYSDELDNNNENSYQIKNHENLYNGDADDPFDQSTHYQYSTSQKLKITIDIDGNYIANGGNTVPIPRRNGYVFAGWLIEPKNLADGGSVNALWKIAGSSMTEDQKQKWYSDKTVTGQTKTITVTFNANGGEFWNGSGDIHSADNKLYYRQGEAYIIENTWMTGENTPNNPFDTQEVATIEQTNNTSNDPYKASTNINTQKGGNVDIIKRVPVGKYIMEELSSPVGYTKGFPVGVSVRENETVQSTEMVDKTIKVEISKIDAANKYKFNRYEDGELETDASGTKTSVNEPKGSYSFETVPDAVLAIYGDNKDNTDYENWIKSTGFVSDDNKHVDAKRGSYITVNTSEPIYIENLPAGNYIISEIYTPDGYITAQDVKVEVGKTDDVQLVLISDDHTKLEVEKYYNDGNNNVVMPNMYRAGLQLKDVAGNVISEWKTDDISDYRNFMKNYETLVSEKKGPDFDSVSWEAERTAIRQSATDTKEKWIISDGTKVLIENGNIPADAPEGFAEAYNNRNKDSEIDKFSYKITLTAERKSGKPNNQIWLTSTGTNIHICTYRGNDFDGSGRQKYISEYKFNYHNDYSGKYKNVVSYDTVDGRHRFDYIPVGNYILHESEVPKGFMQTADKPMEVKETGDIQSYTMLNKQRELVVTKMAQASDGLYYAGIRNSEIMMGNTGIEIKGAELKLYRTEKFDKSYKELFKNGSVPDSATLVTSWTTGNDGVYTKEDEQKERIPKEYQVGDYKPHTIKDVEDGFYYLVETKTPDYYKTAEPIEVEVSNQKSEFNIVNKAMPGKVTVQKNNERGKGLPEASFIIKNKTTGMTAGYIITDNEGRGTLIVDEIGKIGKDGVIEPYTFTIEEINPPKGYQINSEIHEFTFKGTDHLEYASSYNPNDAANVDGVITVTDKETAITISKSDFDTHLGVAGATLAIHKAAYKDGTWKAAGEEIDSWTTLLGNNTHIAKGLVGSENYMLSETSVPVGYVKADNIFFRISSDGKSINKIWTDPTNNAYIEFVPNNVTGAVEKVNFATRTYAGAKTVLTDLYDGTSKEYGTAMEGFTLTDNEITDGHTYRLDEAVRFTDNSETIIRSTTFVAKLSEGVLKIYPKSATTVENLVTNKDGAIIAKWEADGNIHSIENPLSTDPQGITVVNSQYGKRITGQDHEAVTGGLQVVYTIKYDGKGKNVILSPDNQTDIIRTEPEVEQSSDGRYHWTTTEEKGTIKFVATIKDTAYGKINQKVAIEDKSYSYMNPVAINDGTGMLKNTSKIVLFNDVIGNDPTNELASFTYRITLTDSNGNPLNGRYNYRTKNEKNGTHAFDAYGTEKTFDVALTGSDYLVISDLPYNTKYSIKLLVTDDFKFSVQSGNMNDYGNPINLPDGITKKESISNIYFSNTRNLDSERTIFQRNESYEIAERVVMNDGTQFSLSQSGFTLGENCEVTSFDMKNRKYPIKISKQYITGNKELPGAILQVLDLNGNLLEEWTSGAEEHTVKTTLIPGESYILREVRPPDGYTYADDITFTVNKDGTINRVVMYDTFTKVYIDKVDEDSNHIPGAKLQIVDRRGEVVEEWISNGTRHEILNKLRAGETYTLREMISPDGYAYANDQQFTVPKDDDLIVILKDDETKVRITKKSTELNEDGTHVILNGAILQIMNKDKKPVIAIKDTNDFKQGDLIKFTSNQTVDITGLLNADEVYYLHEIRPVDGYAFADDVQFKTNRDNTVTSVEMVDKPIIMAITKTDITGEYELSGAEMEVQDEDGKLIDKWISNETSPHVIENKLIAGKEYALTEKVSPNGYAYVSNITFKVENDGNITVNNKIVENNQLFVKDKPTHVVISKVDITNQKELEGAHLMVRDMEGNIIDEWISGKEPHVIKGILIASTPDRDGDSKWDNQSKYKLIETYPADGYAYANEIEFTVSPDGTIDKVKMEDKLTHIEISKTDITTGEELPGAKLQIVDVADTENPVVVDEWVSGKEPHIIKGKLIAEKSYILREESTPNGYTLAEDVLFTVSRDGSIDKVKMEDKPTQVIISKKDFVNNEELPGAHLQIIDKEGKVIEEWESTKEKHLVKGKLIAGEEYTLHEISSPNGYAFAEDIKFTVSKDGTIDKVEMKDKPTNVEITKVDITTGKELSGAKLELVDKTGKIIEQWTSTNEAHKIVGKLTAGETYILREIYAPKGYTYSNEVSFTVSIDGTINKVEMIDKPTHVEITKTEITTGKELTGANIQIIDKNGSIVESFISTNKPHKIIGKLEAGETYYIHEDNAPDGYGYTSDVKFTVSKDDTINKIDVKDDTLKITVLKWKNEKHEEQNPDQFLGGAVLQIIDSKGNIVDEWKTEEGKTHEIISKFPSTGIYIIPDEVYTVREVTAPEGWAKAPDQTFSPNKDGTIKMVHIVDKEKDKDHNPDKPTITIRKTDSASLSMGIPGAEYTIYDSHGNKYKSVITDNNGEATFTRPNSGTYTYRETKAPEGYMLDNTIYSFTVSDGIVSGNLNLVDYKKPEIDIMKKDINTLELLPGAKLEIYDSQGNKVTEGETGLDGIFVFMPDYDDTYTVVEVKAPDGYRLDKKRYITFTVRDGKVNGETTMYNSRDKEKIGKIDATYDRNINGKGYAWIDDNGILHFGKTGDGFRLKLIVIGWIAAACGLIIMLIRRKRHNEK
ncbi:SpaA isopeptide-forming pilin-related protein [Lacrimispora amygdalina]|uniref:SpaA isopeptide-forming pilin-related protein n=1 Tax=Lacrimispora amygdalina TaxID=253257 RepID=UPI000BE466D5|nr:SpaA isopeptide-forming pilin-related protein [Lacrimispora amygdalina]